MKIPRKFIKINLTQFMNECYNEEALTYFLSNTLKIKKAFKEDGKIIMIKNNDESLSYSPNEVVDEILASFDDLEPVKNVVLYVKSHYDYKKR